MAKVPCSLEVFTLDADSHLCSVEQATLTLGNDVEDGACINDLWANPVLVGKNWSVTANGAIDTGFAAFLKGHSDPVVTVNITNVSGVWTGTGIITNADMVHARRALDKSSFTIQGQGALLLND